MGLMKEHNNGMSRRSFMKGSVLAAGAALAGAAVTGCAPKTLADTGEDAVESSLNFTPGVYHGVAQGRAGDLTVAVHLSEHAIERVDVTSHRDSRILTDEPISRIPAQIVKHQSTKVDTITGATITSFAIINATENALEKAGVDLKDVRVSFDADPVVTPQLVDARIGIVGGGVAGLAATIRAAQVGIPVVLFERSGHLGGDAIFAGGYSWGVDTLMQKAAGIKDSVDLMYKEFTEDRFNPNSKKVWYPDAFRKLIEGSGPTIDWLDTYVNARYHHREVTQGCYGWDLTPRVGYLDGGYNLVEPMIRKVEEGVRDGLVTVLFEHLVTDLMTDSSGNVCGVVAQNAAGEAKEYPFEAVLMATGGFAHNAEMRAEYVGENVQTYTPCTDDGLGFQIIQGLGGAFENMYETKVYGGAMVTDESDFVRYSINQAYPFAFWVGADGKRLYPELNNAMAMKFWGEVADHTGYVIFPKAKRLDQHSMVNRFMFETQMSPWEGWELFDQLLEEGKGVFEADTLEELAQKMGIDAAELSKTVDGINASYESGTEDEFGRTWKCAMEGPFYGITAYAYIIYTQTSAKATLDYKMLKEDGTPIEGLYVAGQLLGLQTPPTTKTQGGNGLSGCYPNQGRLAIEDIIENVYGQDVHLKPFEADIDPADYEDVIIEED